MVVEHPSVLLLSFPPRAQKQFVAHCTLCSFSHIRNRTTPPSQSSYCAARGLRQYGLPCALLPLSPGRLREPSGHAEMCSQGPSGSAEPLLTALQGRNIRCLFKCLQVSFSTRRTNLGGFLGHLNMDMKQKAVLCVLAIKYAYYCGIYNSLLSSCGKGCLLSYWDISMGSELD